MFVFETIKALEGQKRGGSLQATHIKTILLGLLFCKNLKKPMKYFAKIFQPLFIYLKSPKADLAAG